MDDQQDILSYNRHTWDRQIERGNRWTVPVGPEEVARARRGDWTLVLMPTQPVPADWFPPLVGLDVLCLASGGGQQGPILSAAGASVTVYDNNPRQLAQDRLVANREGLVLETIDATHLCAEQRQRLIQEDAPLVIGHTLDDLIGGQIAAGFVLLASLSRFSSPRGR